MVDPRFRPVSPEVPPPGGRFLPPLLGLGVVGGGGLSFGEASEARELLVLAFIDDASLQFLQQPVLVVQLLRIFLRLGGLPLPARRLPRHLAGFAGGRICSLPGRGVLAGRRRLRLSLSQILLPLLLACFISA